MTISAYGMPNPFAEQQLRRRLALTLDQEKIFAAIDDDPALIGAAVVFIDAHGNSVRLREFEAICHNDPIRVVLREPPQTMSAPEFVSEVKSSPRESRIVLEATGAALSCSAAVLAWVVVVTAGGAVAFSGGASGVLTVMAYSAAIASSAQCINGVVRTGMEVKAPQVNDSLDSNEWYRNATIAVDLISLGGASAAGLMTVRGIKILNAQGIPTERALNGLTRAERKRLSREIVRSNYPGISNRMLKYFERTGQVDRRLSNAIIRNTTIRQIKDAVGAGLAFSGSAIGGNIRAIAVAVVADE